MSTDLRAIDQHWSEALDDISAETGLARWHIEETFAYGSCAALALAVAEYRGLELAVIGNDDTYCHAFCVVKPGYGLDIWGVRPIEEILSAWIDDDPYVRERSVTAEELKAMGGLPPSFEFAEMPGRLARDGCIAGVVLDEFTISEFNCGACGDLAAVLHDMTGWPISAEFDRAGDIEHVWVTNPDGCAVDINGVHETGRAITPYSEAKAGRIDEISRQQASSENEHAQEFRSWASELVARYPDRFGLTAENNSAVRTYLPTP